MTTRKLQEALEYAEKGIGIIPLAGKVPFLEDWPALATTDRHRLKDWFASGKWNIGVPTGETNGLLVLDFDVREAARAFFSQHRSAARLIVETRRAVHFAFRMPEKNWPSSKLYIAGEPVGDVKADGGQVCWPTSAVHWEEDGRRGIHNYRFVDGYGLKPVSELAVFDPDWLPKPVSAIRTLTRQEVRNAVNYVMKVESVAGNEGSRGLIRACSILRDSGMSEAEAMVVLIEWNNSGKACPPWSLFELARACRNSYRKGAKSV